MVRFKNNQCHRGGDGLVVQSSLRVTERLSKLTQPSCVHRQAFEHVRFVVILSPEFPEAEGQDGGFQSWCQGGSVLDLQEPIPLLGNGASVIEDLRRQVKRQEDVEDLLPNGMAGRYLTWHRTVGMTL